MRYRVTLADGDRRWQQVVEAATPEEARRRLEDPAWAAPACAYVIDVSPDDDAILGVVEPVAWTVPNDGA